MSVPLSEVRDLDFANDASKVLESTVRKLQYGTITQNERRCRDTATAPTRGGGGGGEDRQALISFLFLRFVTKLLEDLVFFVCVVPNNGQEVLSVGTSTPNRERQKLMREQNILAQVSAATNKTRLRSTPTPSPTEPSASPDLRHPQGSFHRPG